MGFKHTPKAIMVTVAGYVVLTGVNDLTNQNNDSDNFDVGDYHRWYVKPHNMVLWVRGLKTGLNFFNFNVIFKI